MLEVECAALAVLENIGKVENPGFIGSAEIAVDNGSVSLRLSAAGWLIALGYNWPNALADHIKRVRSNSALHSVIHLADRLIAHHLGPPTAHFPPYLPDSWHWALTCRILFAVLVRTDLRFCIVVRRQMVLTS